MKKIIFLIITLLCFSKFIFSQDEKVKSIVVDLYIEKTSLHSEVFNRIQESVRSVADKIILRQKIPDLQSSKGAVEETLKKVFSQALSGFSITDIKLNLGEITGISVYLVPYSDIIQTVTIDVSASGINPYWRNILQAEIENFAPKINSILIGIPVLSSDWTQYILRSILTETISENKLFSGFSVDIEFNFMRDARIVIKLFPKQQIVREVKLKIDSFTLPNLFLVNVRYILKSYLNNIIGLPVEYFETHQNRIKNDIIQIIANSKWKRYFYVIDIYFLNIQENVEIKMNINSKEYYSFVEGCLDMGIKEENIVEMRGLIGKKVTKTSSVFLKSNIFLNNLDMSINAGIGKKLYNIIFVAAERNITKKKDNIWVIFEKEKIRGTYISELNGKFKEASFGYKIKKYFILEGIRKEDKYGLRSVILF